MLAARHSWEAAIAAELADLRALVDRFAARVAG
jgi:hypothetical protein